MVYALKVFKKTSPNAKVTVYLGKRDFVDNITKIEAVDGVAVIDPEYLKGRKLFGQIICSFRYGREEDEVMGLEFQKDLLMASGEIDQNPKKEMTRMQERLVKKIGSNALPFTFELPKNAPPSVTLQPGPEAVGKPCGVEYSLRVFVGENMEDKAHKRSTVSMSIRVIQYAPSQQQGRQPCTIVRRDFVLSPGDLEMELTLDKQLFHHGESVAVHVAITNRSNKTVKKIRAQVLQCIDVCLFEHGTYKTPVVALDSTDGCPVPPGGTLHRTIQLTPRLGSAITDRHGVALDGRLRNEDTELASTTLMANQDDRDGFGIVVTYIVKVRLFLGALAGELVGELPIILMHPKPNPKMLPKMDSVAYETFGSASVDEVGDDMDKMNLEGGN
jgi:arrestin-1